MSITKNISTYPSTGRGFSINHNYLRNTRGVFLTKKDFTLTDSDLDSEDYLRTAFENGDIMPLHYVLDVIPKNEESRYAESPQDYSYELSKGKYRHALKFEWDLAYHQIVEEYNGTDLYVIYYDGNRNLIMTEESTGVYRGIKTNRLVLEKPNLFHNGGEIAYSDLDIELKDPNEIVVNGYIRQVDWLPQLIDKLFVYVDVLTVADSSITFTVKYNSTNITTLQASDITITDNLNGEISGVLLNYSSGAYTATNFSDVITQGYLKVNSTAYLGCARYRVNTIIAVGNNMTFGSGDNMVFGSSDNMVFGN